MSNVSAAPSKLHQRIMGDQTLTWGELLGFILFFLIILTKFFGEYSVWVAIILLFLTVAVY